LLLALSCARSSGGTAGCESNDDCESGLKCFDNVCALPPQLLANSPINFGESPLEIRENGRVVVTNGGDVTLEITDFEITPDDGIFYAGFTALPVKLKGKQSIEISIFFLPQEEISYRSELTFRSNHNGKDPEPVTLLGVGASNIICKPCTPPPEPYCHLDNTASISFLQTTNTSCDNAENICAYQMVETICETECDPETGLCPNVAPPISDYDAGIADPEDIDSGPPPGACSHEILNGDPCNDNDLCTQNDVCTDGVCAGSPLCVSLPNDLCISENTLRHYTAVTGCNLGQCTYSYEDSVCELGCIQDHCKGNWDLIYLHLDTSPGKMINQNKVLRGAFEASETQTMQSGSKELKIRSISSER